MHDMAQQLGDGMCNVIMKAHILTGCDVTSKIGSKSAALSCEPERFLQQFGETRMSVEDNLRIVEGYLVKVSSIKHFYQYIFIFMVI